MNAVTPSIDEAAALFGSVAVVRPQKLSKGKKERGEVDLGPDLDYLAALMVCSKAITETAEQMQNELKHRVLDRFAVAMNETKKRPESFVGASPRATASCELRRASSVSKLSDETVERLTRLGVPCERKEIVPARLVLNPAIVLDQGVLRIVAEALRNEPRLAGVTVVMKQEAEFYNAVAGDTIEVLASKAEDGNSAELRELLEKVTEAASHAGFQGEFKPLVIADPHGGYTAEEQERFRAEASRWLLESDEIVVNLTGGTTLMGMAVHHLLDRGRDLDRPCVRFVLIDRRPPEQQQSEPYIRGEVRWLDQPQGEDHADH